MEAEKLRSEMIKKLLKKEKLDKEKKRKEKEEWENSKEEREKKRKELLIKIEEENRLNDEMLKKHREEKKIERDRKHKEFEKRKEDYAENWVKEIDQFYNEKIYPRLSSCIYKHFAYFPLYELFRKDVYVDKYGPNDIIVTYLIEHIRKKGFDCYITSTITTKKKYSFSNYSNGCNFLFISFEKKKSLYEKIKELVMKKIEVKEID